MQLIFLIRHLYSTRQASNILEWQSHRDFIKNEKKQDTTKYFNDSSRSITEILQNLLNLIRKHTF